MWELLSRKILEEIFYFSFSCLKKLLVTIRCIYCPWRSSVKRKPVMERRFCRERKEYTGSSLVFSHSEWIFWVSMDIFTATTSQKLVK